MSCHTHSQANRFFLLPVEWGKKLSASLYNVNLKRAMPSFFFFLLYFFILESALHLPIRELFCSAAAVEKCRQNQEKIKERKYKVSELNEKLALVSLKGKA